VRPLADTIVAAEKGEITVMNQITVMNRIGADPHAIGVHAGGHMGMSQSEMDMDMPPARTARPRTPPRYARTRAVVEGTRRRAHWDMSTVSWPTSDQKACSWVSI
jgi:hypothetical protein